MAFVETVLQIPSMVTFLGAVLFLLAVYILSFGSSSTEHGINPPGPRPLPLLGNMLIMDLKRPYRTLCEFLFGIGGNPRGTGDTTPHPGEKYDLSPPTYHCKHNNLSKKYGPVFMVHFGPKKVIVLAGYKTVKDALVNQAEDFGDRDITPLFHVLNQGHGILLANGDSWKEMRRFALTNLKDFGMGKKGSEEKISEEITYLIKEFKKHEGNALDTSKPVTFAVSNIISAIVFGSRFEYTDPLFIGMVNRAKENVRLMGSASIQIYNMFPWLGPWIKNLMLIKKNIVDWKTEVMEIVRGLKETLNPQMCRGFVDSFLVRKQTLEVKRLPTKSAYQESGNTDSLYHDDNLVFSVTNLFVAGTDTTGNTLCWGLLLMAKYPHIQDKVQEEITRVIGSRQPLVEDRKNLPYTNAVIHETQRFANIVPMSIPHTTSRDITFQGYFIKKGTCVIPLLTSVLHDEGEWESPHTFNPAHFLDEQGRFIKKEAFMAFSAGRRVCLGESLARMELFLFFTSLLQRFHFSPPPGVTEDDLDLTPAVGFTLGPLPHQLCAVSRV
ncbi:cytochrome P450 2K1 isoform X3 [Esox lucius]|uniref:cytochrome P450 2K1 isoform X3 n=1 Tax=Esox lucius TaxID=8010 RepID=UPI0014775C16|nr:cytochrome P450 2K1 isoform X3 [Esox lucius]